MKGITCCGDCGYYNWKKHRCTRAVDEGSAQSHFYADCPLPDVVPVVHSRWTTKRTIEHDGEWYCENCGDEPTVFVGWDYCPNCGAKMDKGDEDG